MNKTEWFLQEDIKKYIVEVVGKEFWITVYQNIKSENQDMFFYSALIPTRESDEVLEKVEFDFSFPYFGLPVVELHSDNQSVYTRFGVSSGLEPLVLVRDFHNVKPSYIEVAQEFVHFHNLYHDAFKSQYIKIYDDGHEEEVIKYSDVEVKITLKHIKQFLAFKDMCLGIYFETTRFIDKNVEDIGLLKEGANIPQREGLCHLEFWYRNERFFDDNKKAFSRLLESVLKVMLQAFLAYVAC